MGVTICGKTKSLDVACGGFYRLRLKIAELSGIDIYLHYKILPKLWTLPLEKRGRAFDSYDQKTKKLSKRYNGEKDAILDFLYASDSGGEIDAQACIVLYKTIKGYSNDTEEYGYAGRENGSVHFDDFKAVVKECVFSSMPLHWY